QLHAVAGRSPDRGRRRQGRGRWPKSHGARRPHEGAHRCGEGIGAQMTTAADRDYWADPADADRKGFWVFGHLLLVTIAVILVAFVVWADNAVLDIVTRGQGKVIPSSQVQVIQNLEGGIMAGILVHEGDLVEKDQVLLRIDNTTAQSNYDDLHSRYLSGIAAATRLEAEIAGTSADDIVFLDDLMKDAPELADAERKNARIRHDQLETQVAILRDQATQKEQ